MEKWTNRTKTDNGYMQLENESEEKSGSGVVKFSPSLKDINWVIVWTIRSVSESDGKTAKEVRTEHKGVTGKGKKGNWGFRLYNKQVKEWQEFLYSWEWDDAE